MERIKLNLIPSGVPPIVHLSQYDDGRQFAIDLFEGDSVYVLDGTETLTVDSRKPDGHIVSLSVTNTGTSSVVVDTVEQLTAVHGESYAKLKIEKGSVTIATLEFLIAVSRDPSENGDPSDSFIQNLETQVNGYVATAVANQYDSANVIFDNAPTAGHGVGYAVTSEGVETALSGKANTSDIPVNSDFSLSGLSDTTITTPSSGQVLSYDGGKWKNNALLVSKEGIGTLTAVNATVQIPNDVLAKSIIVIVLRRYGYFGTITVSKSQLSQGSYSAGTQVYGDNNNSWKINISNSGVITLVAISGTAFPNVDCYGLF